MRQYLIGGLAMAALPSPSFAEDPSRFELGLQCASAATVSTMLLKQTGAPADLVDNYSSILASVGGMLHEMAPGEGKTDDQIDHEIVQRSNVLVDKINAVPDDGFQAAVFQQISMEPDGERDRVAVVLLDERPERRSIPDAVVAHVQEPHPRGDARLMVVVSGAGAPRDRAGRSTAVDRAP